MRSRIVVAGRVVVAAMLLSGAVHAQAPLFRSLAYDLPPEVNPFHVADFDGDGAADLAAYSGVHLNDGGGRFTTTPSGSASFPSGGAFADFDDDGDLDAFAFGVGVPTVYENVGGIFVPPASATFPAPVLPPGGGFVGDYDGDGFEDLIFVDAQPSYFAPRPVAVWLRVGPFAFGAATPTTLATTVYERVSCARDFDQDGDADVLVESASIFGAVLFRIFRNDGGAFVAAAAVPGANGYDHAYVTAGDYDGDGFLDVALKTHSWAAVAVHFTGPSCAIQSAAVVPVAGVSEILSAVDYDGDGSDDVVVFAGNAARVLAGPAMTAALADLPGKPLFAPADFDGDSDLDVYGDGRVSFRGPTGAYLSADHGLYPAKSSNDADFADFDGDGDVDLWRHVAGLHRLALNDGHGIFSDVVAATFAGVRTTLLDWNTDGLPDLAGFGALDIVFLTAPGPSFGPPLYFPVPGGAPQDVELADLDGNGATDVVLCFGGLAYPGDDTPYAPTQPTVFVFNGSGGVWSTPVSFSSNADGRNLAAVDYDGDGDLDVVQSNHLAPATVFVRQPSTFVEIPYVPTTIAASVVGGDFDGDGDADLVFDGTLHRSDGFGGFVVAGSATVPAWPNATPEHFYFRTDARDLNLDGLLDLLVEGGYFLGTGNGFGSYVPLPGGAPTDLPRRHDEPWRTADLDADGDLDAIDRYGTVFHNTTRQLVRGGRARPGYVASLEAFGPPSTEVVLAASFALAAAPSTIPGWGPVFLDVDAALLVGSATTDATGRAVFAFPVDASAPIGATVYFQAGMPTLGRLTGAAKLTVLGL